MQVYRHMDIGTAKPPTPVLSEVPHALVDIADPEEAVTVATVQRLGRDAISTTTRPVIVSGGSGLHFRAIVDPLHFVGSDESTRAALADESLGSLQRKLLDLDPGAGDFVDMANRRRVERALELVSITGQGPSVRASSLDARRVREYRSVYDLRVVGFEPGPGLSQRIETRFDQMLDSGLLEEVEALKDRLGPTASQAVGYKELIPVVEGSLPLADGRRDAIAATVALAKRQRTWFRRDPRVRWLEWDDDPVERQAALKQEAGDWAHDA